MKWVAFAGVAVLALLAAAPLAQSSRPAAGSPIVVELFTSEGCSSCPPADDLLARVSSLAPGVQVIALGEHVDYWDSLGWRDRFSSPQFTSRQAQYSRALRSDTYTPQMIVNGRLAFVGGDAGEARRAIAAAAREPAVARVSIALAAAGSGALSVTARVEPVGREVFATDLAVTVALTEDGLATMVKGGENGGRTLKHAAVVRTLRDVGVVNKNEPARSFTIAVPTDWHRAALSVVAFASESASHRIVGADSQKP